MLFSIEKVQRRKSKKSKETSSESLSSYYPSWRLSFFKKKVERREKISKVQILQISQKLQIKYIFRQKALLEKFVCISDSPCTSFTVTRDKK